MKTPLIVLLVGLAGLADLAHGNAQIMRSWEYVKVKTSALDVELQADKSGERIAVMRVWLDGKRVTVPSKAFADILRPSMRTLEIGACTSSKISTCSVLGITYYDDIGDEPKWWEPPIAYFRFENGDFSGRSTRRKVSERVWETQGDQGAGIEEALQRPGDL